MKLDDFQCVEVTLVLGHINFHHTIKEVRLFVF